ncbi:hypothetical protein PE066_05625 [Ramlibacter tataouinensis]|nr:hypothetical protein [Ramlibacter tataouinensis]WBY03016.1 hypothetical protein PE066_05625 [Ramlibacter tataouinensis]
MQQAGIRLQEFLVARTRRGEGARGDAPDSRTPTALAAAGALEQ